MGSTLKLNGKQRKLLDRLYKDVNSAVCFTSVKPLFEAARQHDKKISRKQVEEYLSGQDVYTLHRRAVRKYPKMPTLAPGLHTEWQGDLAIFDRLARQNKGYKYLLVCIDILSRQLFVEPVKTKSAEYMIDAFERLFARSQVIPWRLLTDQGKEFTARRVQDYFKAIELQHGCMYTSPQLHAGMAERANRSIKERLYRYFTERRTQKWIDVIQQIVDSINCSYNSTIGMRPIDVTYENAEMVRKVLVAKAKSKFKRKRRYLQEGDQVRIEKHKHIFQKGYLPRFTNEIFIIDKIRHTIPYQPVTYAIRDLDGEPIKGWFYSSDLCRVGANTDDDSTPIYDIERVLRKQKRDGEDFVYVKWKGYGAEHNGWIPASSLIWRE